MALTHKLKRWTEAGVIDGDTAARIEAFESRGRRPVLLLAMSVLGALTVGIGVISVVAANWDGIAPGTKIGLDLGLLALLGAAVFVSDRREALWAREVLTLLLYGFTLASLALVGQVYQFGTPTWVAMVVWSVATLPLLSFSRTRYLAGVFFFGLVTSYGVGMVEFIDWAERGPLPEQDVIASVVWALPVLLLAGSQLPVVARLRPAIASTFRSLSWAGAAVLAAGQTVVFYDRVSPGDTLRWGLVVVGVLFVLWGAALPRFVPSASAAARRGVLLLLVMTWCTLLAAAGFDHGHLEKVAAFVQLGYLAVLAWVAVQMHAMRAFNVLTGLIALRILIIYFEVFGTLLSTGVGMITGGALMLALAWGWKRFSPDLARQLQAEPEGGTQ